MAAFKWIDPSLILLIKTKGAVRTLKAEKQRPRVFFFSQLKIVCKNRKISLRTKVRLLEATGMTVIKYGSET